MGSLPVHPPRSACKVKLPGSGGEYVLIFLPAAKDSAEPCHIDAVSLPESGFRSGDYAFVNYSGNPVGCDISGERLLVPHGKSAVYQALKSGTGAGNRPLVCYQQKGGTWESTPFLSSRIIIQEGGRNLVLICLDPKTGCAPHSGLSASDPRWNTARAMCRFPQEIPALLSTLTACHCAPCGRRSPSAFPAPRCAPRA